MSRSAFNQIRCNRLIGLTICLLSVIACKARQDSSSAKAAQEYIDPTEQIFFAYYTNNKRTKIGGRLCPARDPEYQTMQEKLSCANGQDLGTVDAQVFLSLFDPQTAERLSFILFDGTSNQFIPDLHDNFLQALESSTSGGGNTAAQEFGCQKLQVSGTYAYTVYRLTLNGKLINDDFSIKDFDDFESQTNCEYYAKNLSITNSMFCVPFRENSQKAKIYRLQSNGKVTGTWTRWGTALVPVADCEQSIRSYFNPTTKNICLSMPNYYRKTYKFNAETWEHSDTQFSSLADCWNAIK